MPVAGVGDVEGGATASGEAMEVAPIEDLSIGAGDNGAGAVAV